MEIAVLVGANGETAPIQEDGEILVYDNSHNNWQVSLILQDTIWIAVCLHNIRW